MYFNVAVTMLPIGPGEIEIAYFAGERLSGCDHRANFLFPESWVSLAIAMKTFEYASLVRAGLRFVGWRSRYRF